MTSFTFPFDAFSHGQIRSKLWLVNQLNLWTKSASEINQTGTLHWYGSWIGVGPFILLSQLSSWPIKEINLYDLKAESLNQSVKILDYWRCEGVSINTHCVDINLIKPANKNNQFFINTSCEHLKDNTWLENIPSKSYVLLQSTNMEHIEHINKPDNLADFIEKNSRFINVIEKDQIDFFYPDKTFSRFMLLGQKK